MPKLTDKGKGHNVLEGKQGTPSVTHSANKVSTDATLTAGRKILTVRVRRGLVTVLPAWQLDKTNIAGCLTQVQTPC